jgi:uncharacterized protein YsxB (DUF464 family)
LVQLIRYKLDASNCRLQVDGHAGAGAPGQDPVCAGASVLVLTLVENVRSLPGAQIRVQPGSARVACRPGRKARHIFRVLERGFAVLQTLAPEYVKEEP